MSDTFFTDLSDEALDQAIKDARKPPSIADVERKKRHAEAQAKSDDKRREVGKPRRDDLARAAYYVLLLTILKDHERGEVERADRIRHRVLLVMEDVGFDRDGAARMLDAQLETTVDDLKSWARKRAFDRTKSAADKE